MRDADGGHVIMIEDDPSMCQALVRILRLGGFVPMAYVSAEEFLRDAREPSAVCMIVDVRLPGMDGFALIDHLAARGSIPPVIFITAFEEPGARAQAAKTGAAFLAKPFSGREILETVRATRGAGPLAQRTP
jgi:FixJ family two-component response regulator